MFYNILTYLLLIITKVIKFTILKNVTNTGKYIIKAERLVPPKRAECLCFLYYILYVLYIITFNVENVRKRKTSSSADEGHSAG